jgi:transposase-like protein
MRGIKIPKELKLRIIAESLEVDCDLVKLCQHHGISRQAIYRWRSNYNKTLRAAPLASGKPELTEGIPIAANKFVELTLSDKPQGQSLSRAELVFADFSISMEGRIKSAALLSIVRILEESC